MGASETQGLKRIKLSIDMLTVIVPVIDANLEFLFLYIQIS